MSFMARANNCLRVPPRHVEFRPRKFRRANEFAQIKFPPIGLERFAVFRMPRGGSLDLADVIENTASFEDAGETDTHDPASGYSFCLMPGSFPRLSARWPPRFQDESSRAGEKRDGRPAHTKSIFC
jgi:hypothetical protein